MRMSKESVARALPYNCPRPGCDVAIGQLCLSKHGRPMAFAVHRERTPVQEGLFTSAKLKRWLSQHAHILTDPE